jgi:hypothetical protein
MAMKRQTVLLLAVFSVTAFSCSKDDNDSSTTSNTNTTTTTSTWYCQSEGTATLSGKTYYSTVQDTSAVKVTGSGSLTLSNCRIWSSGKSSSNDNSSFYGLNAGVLAYNGNITLTNDSIRTTGAGANGVFAYGSGSVTMSGDTVICTGEYAHGIMCSGGGTINATNVYSTSAGGSSSVIATDRGGGTINVTGGTYIASGSNSAAIYSTGTITCNGSTLTANGAESLVIEGANNITLTNCTTKSTKNKWGTLIYQSMSGDASGAIGTLTINSGSLTYTGTNGGLFYNTNDTAKIYLNGVTINNSCDTLVRSILGSWGGSSATSGGNTYLICSGQTISGLVYADANSDVVLELKNSSVYSGRVNTDNKAKKAIVTLDSSSSWSLTGNTYLTSFTNANTSNSNITTNGYKLYVNGTQLL